MRPVEGRESIAPLRVIGIDIECIKDEGMPDARRHPIIIIGVVACRAVNGVVDAAGMRNVVFTWYPPGSGGVDGIPSIDQVFYPYFSSERAFNTHTHTHTHTRR